MISKTIELFLDSIGRREEYEYYLKRFHTSATPAFALICPEIEDLDEAAELLSFDMEFLLRLDIHPALLVCGNRGPETLELFNEDEHPYAKLKIALGSDPMRSVGEINSFLKRCRDIGRIGLVFIEDIELGHALDFLVPEVSKRVHIARARGPLHDAGGRALMNYYTRRQDQPPIADEDAPILSMVEALLDRNPDLHISIASPLNLLQELFTVRGAGCLVRRGSIIRKIENPAEIELGRLATLMRSSFDRDIRQGVIERCDSIFLEENYRGAALLEKHPVGLYLSKFAVDTQARGEGLASEIWSEMVSDKPPIFWRSRSNNPINHWYMRQSDGHNALGDWSVYWRGVEWRDIPAIIKICTDRADDFE